jgi:hypothetical protein
MPAIYDPTHQDAAIADACLCIWVQVHMLVPLPTPMAVGRRCSQMLAMALTTSADDAATGMRQGGSTVNQLAVGRGALFRTGHRGSRNVAQYCLQHVRASRRQGRTDRPSMPGRRIGSAFVFQRAEPTPHRRSNGRDRSPARSLCIWRLIGVLDRLVSSGLLVAFSTATAIARRVAGFSRSTLLTPATRQNRAKTLRNLDLRGLVAGARNARQRTRVPLPRRVIASRRAA